MLSASAPGTEMLRSGQKVGTDKNRHEGHGEDAGDLRALGEPALALQRVRASVQETEDDIDERDFSCDEERAEEGAEDEVVVWRVDFRDSDREIGEIDDLKSVRIRSPKGFESANRFYFTVQFHPPSCFICRRV